MKPNLKRDIQLSFRVTPSERSLIEQKMAQIGIVNKEAYLRKMSLDGYVLRLDIPELKEIVRLLRYTSNNLNQLTKRAHETGAVYAVDIEGLRDSYDGMWGAVERIMAGLSKI